MSTIVAGFFGSEADATQAMDALLKDQRFHNAKSEVMSNLDRMNDTDEVVAAPVVPNPTGISGGSTTIGMPVISEGDHHLLSQLDEPEADYFRSAMTNSSGVLALMQVEDDQASYVRRVFSQNGARTYQE